MFKLLTDTTLKAVFKEKSLINSWADISRDYEQLFDKALKFMFPFTNTELVTFFSNTFIKNKCHCQSNEVLDLKRHITAVEHDFKKLFASKQAQGSH